MKHKPELDRLGIAPLLISADPPEVNRRFRERLGIPFVLLSDEDHAVADRYGVPVSRRHWNARKYNDGFIQPALFAYRGEEELYRWITRPNLLNLYGAARRPTADEVLARLRSALGR
jgi:peroxiredoxin Q/BCP